MNRSKDFRGATYRMTRLSFFLIRNTNGYDDDKVIVSPVNDDFKIQYISNNAADSFHHFFYANEGEAYRYIYDLLYALNRDAAPYQSIQINIPCFPSVIYKATEMTPELCDVLVGRVNEVLKNWPETVRFGSLPQ